MKNILVILAAFNGEKYISEQINSILNQNSVNITILVFDDCSCDSTRDIVSSIIKQDRRVKIFKNKSNSGSPALNFINSIKNLDYNYLRQFDYISLSDQDDIWLKSKLIAAVNSLQSNNGSLYASNLTIWDTSRQTKKLLKKDYPQTKFDFLFEGASAGCTYVISTELILKFKQDFSNLDFSQWKYLSHDWLLYFYARIHNEKVLIDSNSYILYRIHDSNVHGVMNLNSLKAIKSKIKLFYSGWYRLQMFYFSKFILSPTHFGQKIYSEYSKNWLSRVLMLVKYHNALFRSYKKFVIFACLTLFYFNARKKC